MIFILILIFILLNFFYYYLEFLFFLSINRDCSFFVLLACYAKHAHVCWSLFWCLFAGLARALLIPMPILSIIICSLEKWGSVFLFHMRCLIAGIDLLWLFKSMAEAEDGDGSSILMHWSHRRPLSGCILCDDGVCGRGSHFSEPFHRTTCV